MTNQEILDQIAKMEKGLNNPSLPESAKTAFKGKIAGLKAELEKSEAKVEKKEEKLQAEEKKIQSELESQIAKLEKGLTNKSLPESAKDAIRKKINAAKEELAKQKVEIKEDKKESEAEKKEVKAAVKKVTELAKKAGKVKTKRKSTPKVEKSTPKVEIKEEEREKKSEKRQTKLSGMMAELESLIHKNKYLASKYEGKGVDLDRDAHRPAKPFGYRFTGKDNYAVPTKEQIRKGLKDGTIDYEGRPNRADKSPKKEYKLAHGGYVEGNQNAEMVLSKAKELHHHATELENIVKPNSDVEAWEVAKMERASTDASDVTHYEDGKKMADGGYMADGGQLKEEDYVWNALGKKLIVDKVTDDEYYLTSFGQSSASTFSKKKVDGYIKSGKWSLNPKYAKGGKLSSKATYIPKYLIEEVEINKNGKEVEIDGANLLDGIYVKKASYNKKADGGKMAKGGFVSKGELVWRKLSDSKKMEFLYENFTPQITPTTQQILVGKDFQFLPKDVKIKLEAKYANVEEYANGGQLEVGDMVMVDDSGYVKYFSGFDTNNPAKIILKDKGKSFGKVKYFYGLQMADGRKPFNNAEESMLTKVSKDGGMIEKLDKKLKSLENINSKEAYNESQKVRETRSFLLAKMLHEEEDIENYEKEMKSNKMAKGGKTQGYDDKEDERLAMEHGKMAKKDLKSTHSRKDDARFEERGKMAKGGTIKPKSNKKGNQAISQIAALAKTIRKEGEKWTDAIKRASAQLKKG